MTNNRNELRTALRNLNFTLNGTDVTDGSVSGYNQDRNIAQVRENANGTFTVNVWRGHWYKHSEAVVVDSVQAVIAEIENRPKRDVS